MRTLTPKWVHDETLIEMYWGIGFGFTRIDHKNLIILPFFIVMITEKEVYI